jgi:Domain of unknown function (DUF5667)
MPAGQGKDAERFAAAVESRAPLGAADDADLARELEIVAMLRSRGAAFAPDAETKARAKQRLMAVLAAEQGGPRPAPRPAAAPPAAAELTAPLGRLVEREDVDATAETTLLEPVTAGLSADDAGTDSGNDAETDSDTAVEPIPLHGDRAGRRGRHSLGNRRTRSARRTAAAGLRRRVVLVGSAAAAAMLAIAGGGVLASGDALPGDALYPVKRVAESAGLALTFDDASRAHRQLEIAATRLSEVEQLTRDRQAQPAPEVFTAAMDDFDAATDEGSRLLLAATESDQASTATDDLRTWAAEQSERLTELEPELPAAADANTSKQLLERLLGQTGKLEAGTACDEGDCASRDTADKRAPESDVTEDATSTRDEDSADASETDEPSRTPAETGDREEPRLLPDLVPDANREDRGEPTTSREDEDSTSTSEPDSGDEGDGGNVAVPLPLLPPVTLPPLLPGMPGITIG